MTWRFVRRWTAVLLSFWLFAGLTAGFAAPTHASDPEARTVSIFRIDGTDLELSRGARATAPRDGQRLADGNVLSTGRDTFVYMLLDSESIVKMDQQSQVAVTNIGNRLILTVQSGSALVSVEPQEEGQTMETRMGNRGLTVRGTLFVKTQEADGSMTITMLSGSGEVNNVPLYAGSVMTIWEVLAFEYGIDEDMRFQIHRLDLTEATLFVLESVAENIDYLLDLGIITQEDAQMLPDLIEQRREELLEEQAQNDALVDGVLGDLEEEDDTVIRPFDDDDGEEPGDGADDTTEPGDAGDTGDTGDTGGGDITDPETEYLTVTMLNIGADGATIQHRHRPGAQVNINAGARPGYTFAGWTSVPSVSLANAAAAATHFTMPRHNVTLTANWYGDVIIITNEAQWLAIENFPHGGLGLNFRLADDFTVTRPLTVFNGTLDGVGHIITLDIDDSTEDALGLGLFRTLGETAVVENLRLRGNVTGAGVVGGLAGFNNGTIRNVNFDTGTVSNASDHERSATGGLVGFNEGMIERSNAIIVTVNGTADVGGIAGANFGDIWNSEAAHVTVRGARVRIGGVAGFNGGTIYRSRTNESDILNPHSSNVGGVVGQSSGSGVSIQHAYSTNTVVSGRLHVGGIAGYSAVPVSYARVSGGTVSGAGAIGGVVGWNSSVVSSGQVSDMVVEGTTDVGGLAGLVNGGVMRDGIAADSVTVRAVPTDGFFTVAIGGLAGTVQNGGLVENSLSRALVSGGDADSVGGLAGYLSGGTISGSSAFGNVSGRYNVGGLVGHIDGNIGGAALVSRSFSNNHLVEGVSGVGGLVGIKSGGVVSDSYSLSNAAGHSEVGGLVGAQHQGSIVERTFAAGTVVAADFYAGGITGFPSGGSIIRSSVNFSPNISAFSILPRRIANGAGLSNNFAFEGTQINSLPFAGVSDINGVDGGTATTDLLFATLVFWFGPELGFNYDVWQVFADRTPVLRNVPGQTSVVYADIGQTFPISWAGLGTDVSPPPQSARPGAQVPAIAGTIPGYTFVRWISSPSVIFADEYNPNTTFTMPNSPVTITAESAPVSGSTVISSLADWRYYLVENLTDSGAGQLFVLDDTVGVIDFTGFTDADIVPFFDGIFEGMNAIINVGINFTNSANEAGMFRTIMPDGIVRNLGITGSVNGGSAIVGLGLLAGINHGTIFNVSSTADVVGLSNVGGLVAVNSGVIDNSAVTAHITGNGAVGGLAFQARAGSLIIVSHANVEINGANNVGGLVGNALGTGNEPEQRVRIEESSANIRDTGINNGTGNVGGLVGSMENTTITNSYSTGTIRAAASTVGGLVGLMSNNSRIENTSYSSATVIAGMDNAGGLVGDVFDASSSIYISYASGNVSGESNVGGLAGRNAGNIQTSRFVGDVAVISGTNNVGGLVGLNTATGRIENSSGVGTPGVPVMDMEITAPHTGTRMNFGGLVGFNSGGFIADSHVLADGLIIQGDQSTGGFVGANLYGGRVESCLVDGTSIDILGRLHTGGFVGENGSVTGTAGITDSHINTTFSTVTGSSMNVGGFAGSNHGTIVDSSVQGERFTVHSTHAGALSANTGGFVGFNQTGGGISGGTVNISILEVAANDANTGGQVGGFAGNNAAVIDGGSRVEGEFIEVLGQTAVGGFAGVSSGTMTDVGVGIVGGFEVEGESNIGGLIGLMSAGSIENAYVAGLSVDIVGTDATGGLVGNAAIAATITLGHVSGDVIVRGEEGTGGLVGVNSAAISRSFADVTVNGTTSVGGLVGTNSGTISNSYALGDVTGTTNVGGLVGSDSHQASALIIDRSFAAGSVDGETDVGGLVGRTGMGSVAISNSAVFSHDVFAGAFGIVQPPTTPRPEPTLMNNWTFERTRIDGIRFYDLDHDARNPNPPGILYDGMAVTDIQLATGALWWDDADGQMDWSADYWHFTNTHLPILLGIDDDPDNPQIQRRIPISDLSAFAGFAGFSFMATPTDLQLGGPELPEAEPETTPPAEPPGTSAPPADPEPPEIPHYPATPTDIPMKEPDED